MTVTHQYQNKEGWRLVGNPAPPLPPRGDKK
jgi:hypothetical protein